MAHSVHNSNTAGVEGHSAWVKFGTVSLEVLVGRWRIHCNEC